MNNTSIILSISILISGRKEMRQCLDSIKPFLEQLPCELILVDTGCNEEQLAIAREYTDVIVPFTWCNDFSAARNVGLLKARGEWFLYLDDDEWFEDPSEIVDFFKTGEYKDYSCARYYQRNYTKRGGAVKPYVDNVVLRMTKLTPDVRFHGIIHEFLQPVFLPIKDFGTWVEHYGYIFDSDEDKYKHVERNASLLWKQIAMEPISLRWYSQLIQEYMGVEEYEQVIELCKKAFKVWDSYEYVDNTQIRSLGAIYGYIAKAYEQKYNYEKALSWAHKGIENKLLYDCAKAYLYQIQIEIYQKQKKYRKCMESFLAYISIYKEKGQDKYVIATETSLINNVVFQEIPYILITLRGLLAASEEREKEVLEEYFYTLDWSDKRLFGQEDLEKSLLQYACENQEPVLLQMIKTLGEREHGILELSTVMAKLEASYLQDNQEEYLWSLRSIAAQIDSEHQYVLACKILVAEKCGKMNELEKLYEKIFLHCETVYKYDDAIWDIAAQYAIPIEEFLLHADFNQWKNGTDEWCSRALPERIREWQERIGIWKTKNNIRYEYFYMRCSEALLYREAESVLSFEEQENMLWQHAECVLQYYGNLYKEEVFQNIPAALPLEAQLAVNLRELQKYRMQENDQKALACLRKCVGLYPILEKVIDNYAKQLRDAVQKRNQEELAEQTEFLQLVTSLKNVAKTHIENKNYQGAKEILEQVQQCVPEDHEIEMLLKQLES